jgi:hypothetical protein
MKIRNADGVEAAGKSLETLIAAAVAASQKQRPPYKRSSTVVLSGDGASFDTIEMSGHGGYYAASQAPYSEALTAAVAMMLTAAGSGARVKIEINGGAR